MDATLFSAHLVRGLTDKIYDKRKSAALEIERLVRDNETTPAHITEIIDTLVQDFVYNNNSNARNGGLIGLAATAIALGPAVAPYLDIIVPPILSCFGLPDSRVRYYACESMYNIAKVAKGEVLRFFNSIFDALCKLAADPTLTVKNGADLLDRLIKDIVSELSTTYVSPHQEPYNPPESEQETDDLVVPRSLPRNTAFSLPRFIPVLKQRIYVKNSFTRQYLVSWISVLDSIPDLELVSFLPEFLDGLLHCLSDPSRDVRVATSVLLGEFLQEIKQAAAVRDNNDSYADEEISSHSSSGKGTYVPGQGVIVQYDRIVETLVQHLSSPEEDIQRTALQWMNEFISIAKDVVIQFTPRIILAVLPCLAHPTLVIQTTAKETNENLQRLVLEASTQSTTTTTTTADMSSSPPAVKANSSPSSGAVTAAPVSVAAAVTTTTAPTDQQPQQQETDISGDLDVDASPPQDRSVDEEPFDYQATVSNLRLQFLNENKDTRVASLEWLLMLHKKAPTKILASDDGTFPALLKTLSDSSDEVVRRDLQLLAQISSHSNHEYFRHFMTNLLSLFSTDRDLLETRGSLIIRQLCLSLDPERIYTTIADILGNDEDLEFASIMVQNLNLILITASELSDLRKRLRNLDHKDGQRLFITLYRSWCHNAVATFSLCLLAQAYEHAANMLQIFAELEITVSMLIQVDKLVQLLESPVFTYLRLQLLEPEKHPYLFKCLYGILMLLPQSSAFSTLRNRLSSVSSLGFFHMMPNKSIPQTEPSTTKLRGTSKSSKTNEDGIKFQELLQHFKTVQSRHEREPSFHNYRDDSSNNNLVSNGISNGSGTINNSKVGSNATGTTSTSSGLLNKRGGGSGTDGTGTGNVGNDPRTGNNGNGLNHQHHNNTGSTSSSAQQHFMRATSHTARVAPRKTTAAGMGGGGGRK
ncbi:vacuolar protein 14 C-terminal Fig4p binding-domain-containing protein [Zychaea mexicana]|uniref:vacuolar protein 14 C-terminal Fig4p binding-domain-containing protein n=1 Tax=Zychaea mexicana TaxID=64656 RepID=UPI0022FDE0F3|nr:vacuolar protein 14 C-terminal Fig4p binding-domain-containing protein [Zychaea mexicana]KAI9468660.1 vacuolar protein 14 C-terminal Fig4p binding-domain-containing protein [Zychaea mexicana]